MLNKFNIIKRSGKLVSELITTLLILPFLGVASVNALLKSGLTTKDSGKENAYYDVKNNEKINWRLFLMAVAQRFNVLFSEKEEDLSVKSKQIKALVLDDSCLEKTGKHIEGIGYVHNHINNTHILGFKLLVCGYYDGLSFIPIDFSLHRENRSDKLKKTEERLNKKKDKLKRKLEEIKELRLKKKINKTNLFNCQQSLDKKFNKTNKKNLERKESIKINITKRLNREIAEKKSLEITISELETIYFDLKTSHCGLNQKQYKEQFKKKRERNTFGSKRKQECNISKIDSSIKMLKRAIRKGFRPDYVLTDSWFFCKKILDAVIQTGRSLNLVSMAKIGTAKYKILLSGKLLNPHEIITRYERKKSKENRKYSANYIELQAEYQGIRVKIFLVKFGKHASWRLLVTTDLQMSFTRIIEVYKIRWTIEVFFKECKQHLYLGKCQSQDFDAQIADTTLSLVRYILLSFYERIHYGMTIGGIFRNLTQASIKENLLADISFYFMELLKLFANCAGIDFMTFYEDLIRNPEANNILLKMNLNLDKQIA